MVLLGGQVDEPRVGCGGIKGDGVGDGFLELAFRVPIEDDHCTVHQPSCKPVRADRNRWFPATTSDRLPDRAEYQFGREHCEPLAPDVAPCVFRRDRVVRFLAAARSSMLAEVQRKDPSRMVPRMLQRRKHGSEIAEIRKYDRGASGAKATCTSGEANTHKWNAEGMRGLDIPNAVTDRDDSLERRAVVGLSTGAGSPHYVRSCRPVLRRRDGNVVKGKRFGGQLEHRSTMPRASS